MVFSDNICWNPRNVKASSLVLNIYTLAVAEGDRGGWVSSKDMS
jgi:hypothetical protein